ncbi:MAG: response regulator [Elusimicrobiota bacterium]|nr:response regulator [Elusimicrobiota bacterium]
MAKILLVEDDKSLSFLLQTILQKKSYLIMTAYTGQTALDWIENSKPDLILLDVGLPDMNGLEVCKKIKNNSATRRIPVIILTAFNDNQTKMKANLIAHADLFLNKPIDNNDLLSSITMLLDKSSAERTLRRNLFRRTKSTSCL